MEIDREGGRLQVVFPSVHRFLLVEGSFMFESRIREGKSIEYLTPPAVVEEITLSKLYQNND